MRRRSVQEAASAGEDTAPSWPTSVSVLASVAGPRAENVPDPVPANGGVGSVPLRVQFIVTVSELGAACVAGRHSDAGDRQGGDDQVCPPTPAPRRMESHVPLVCVGFYRVANESSRLGRPLSQLVRRLVSGSGLRLDRWRSGKLFEYSMCQGWREQHMRL